MMPEYEIINTETGEVVDRDLAHHEATIERGLKTFVEVGQALQAIRDGRLYREQYETFEAYLADRWQMKRTMAHYLIESSSVVESLRVHNCEQLPATESVARPLTKLPASEQAEAWEEVVAEAEETGEKITAKKVEQVVANRVDNHRAKGTGENEWYTPAKYIELARKVLGSFDLDPASSQIAQKGVKSGQFFTIDDDGLEQPWFGKVWLNPPYAQPAIAQFCEKMVNEYMVGNVSEAIMLTHNYTDTAWFHCAAPAASAICFTRGRIAFESPDGKKAAPTQGQAFFYFGSNPEKFAEVFGEVGFVCYGGIQ